MRTLTPAQIKQVRDSIQYGMVTDAYAYFLTHALPGLHYYSFDLATLKLLIGALLYKASDDFTTCVLLLELKYRFDEDDRATLCSG